MSSSYPGEEPRRDDRADDAAQDVEHTQPVGHRPPAEEAGYGQGTGQGYGQGTGQGYGQGTGQGYGQGYGQGTGQGYGQGYGQGTGQGYDRSPQHGQPWQQHDQVPSYGSPAPGYGGHGGYGPASPYGTPAPQHGQATTAMVLGIIGLASIPLLCGLGLFVSPVAWALGRSSLRTIRASGGRIGGEGQARAGYVMGVIGTVLLVLALVALVSFVVLAAGLAGPESTYEYGDV